MKKYLLLLLLICGTGFAQKTLNNYKYAVVPKKFDFLNEADQYKLSTYVKMYMEKYGFTTYFDDAIPPELVNENCNKVYVNLNESNTTFVTKVTVVIRDCMNKILFTSAEGTSRAKEYKVAYPAALRVAFSSFDSVNYNYQPSSNAILAANPAQSTVVPNTVAVTPLPNSSLDGTSPATNTGLLFAQPIPNGFQLVDTTPKVLLKIKNTSMPNVFIAERDTLKGVLFRENDQWVFEFYVDDKLYSEKLNVKF